MSKTEKLPDTPAAYNWNSPYTFPAEAVAAYLAGDAEAAHLDQYGLWREGPGATPAASVPTPTTTSQAASA